ncbi:MAG: hypothetical protein QM831_09630 [Kofleriaceae bacterium]
MKLLLLLLGACTMDLGNGAPPVDAGGSGSASADAAAALAPTAFDLATLSTVMTYKSAAFKQVNKDPYTSTVGDFQINVYVLGDDSTYWKVHPETDTTVTVKEGTVIVREVLDATGAISKITAIAKAPSGFDPTLGDWWFAETDPTGTPSTIGAVAACHSCHIPRAVDDYLFGVPKTVQARLRP